MSITLPAIRISKDGLRCILDLPWRGVRARTLDYDTVVEGLLQQGIKGDLIDRDRLKFLVENARQEGHRHRDVLVAVGKPATQAGHLVLQPVDTFEGHCVFAGDLLARLAPAAQDEKGISVTGDLLVLSSHSAPPRFDPGEGVELSSDGERILATLYGRPWLCGMHLRILPGLEIDTAGLTARLDFITNRVGGRQVSETQLEALLAEAGIVEEALDRSALSEGVRGLWEGLGPFLGRAIAHGKPPETGSSGAPELLGNPDNQMALPGEIIARRRERSPPVPGWTVTGEVLDSAVTAEPGDLTAGPGAELSLDAASVTATTLGRTTRVGSDVGVESCVHIDSQAMVCRMDVLPERLDGSPMEPEVLVDALQREGLASDRVDMEALRDALGRAWRSGLAVLDVTVAQGKAPLEGMPPRLESAGELGLCCVFPGDTFAQWVSPSPPMPGFNVHGDLLPAPPPHDQPSLKSLEGCEVVDAALVATVYGQGVFDAEGPHVDPGVRVAEDASTAEADIFGMRIGNTPLNKDLLVAEFVRAGLDPDTLDHPAIEAALDTARASEAPQRNVMIAQAISSQPGRPGNAPIPQSSPACAALPGEAIVTRVSPTPGRAGQDVRGQVLETPEPQPDLILDTGEGCALSKDGDQVLAERYGEPVFVHSETPDGVPRLLVEIQQGIRVTADGMMARLDVFPLRLDGTTMSLGALQSVLENAGIVPDRMDVQGLELALSNSIQVDVPLRSVPVARGLPPVEAEGWHIQAISDDKNCCALPEMAFARIIPDIEPVQGMTVRGEPIAVDLEPDFEPRLGAAVTLSEEGDVLVSTCYGKPRITRIAASVDEGIRISDDLLQCDVDLFPRDVTGAAFTSEKVVGLLLELGIHQSSIDRDRLNQSIAEIREKDQPLRGVCLAQGRPPVDGHDGYLTPEFGPEAGCALPGDLLARIVPAVPAEEAFDVMGTVIPTEAPGEDVAIQLGEGCERIDDTVVSTRFGEPFAEGNSFRIQPGLQISDDGLTAEVDVFHGRLGQQELQTSDLVQVLLDAGVVAEAIEEPTLSMALDTARKNICVIRAVVGARGTLPSAGSSGVSVPVGNHAGCVLPNDIFAQIEQSQPGTPGQTVLGSPIPAAAILDSERLVAGEGCTVGIDGQSAQATLYGHPSLEGNTAAVRPGIRIAADQLAAFMDVSARHFQGEELELNTLVHQLVEAGIHEDRIDKQALEAGLSRSRSAGDRPVEMQVASGKRPTSGDDGFFQPLPELEISCVFPGSVMGHVVAPSPPREGVDVTGKKIPPRRGVTEVKLKARSGCFISQEGDAVAAEFYGRTVLEEPRVTERPGKPIDRTELLSISVVPGLRHAEDGLSSRMDVFGTRADGEKVFLEDLVKILGQAGIDEPCIQLDVLEQALEQSLETGEVVENVLAAKGIDPRHGADGSRLIVGGDLGQAGSRMTFGRFDYRERAFFRTVTHGDAVAQMAPPEDGNHGQTIFGELLEAKDGEPLKHQLGPGVEMHDGIVFALRDGVLSIREDFIDVVDLLVIDGDVDFQTGHVKVDSGSVQISGAVLPGFRVEAPGDILVGGHADNCLLVAGGSIMVRGSLLGGPEIDGGRVRAGSHVAAKLARDVDIVAGGDVVIQREAFNCTMAIDGWLLMESKPGVVSGGVIHACAGARVCSLGTPQWVRTHLVCGGERRNLQEIRGVLERYEIELERFHKDFGTEPDKAILKRTSSRLQERTGRRLERRAQVVAEVARIRQELLDEEHVAERRPPPVIDIKETVYPKCMLEIGGSRMLIETETHKSHFWYDTENHSLQRSPLGTRDKPVEDEPQAEEQTAPEGGKEPSNPEEVAADPSSKDEETPQT